MDVMDSGYRLPSRSKSRLCVIRQHPARISLSAHYGRSAVREVRSGHPNNAAEYAEVAWHHALEAFGRRFGDRQRIDNIAFCCHSDLA